MAYRKSTCPAGQVANICGANGEQARLDDAMRRADELLIDSLKGDERRRYQRVLLFSLGGAVMLAILCTLSLWSALPGAVDESQSTQAAQLAADGWRLWQQRDFGQAVKKFEQATKLDPRNISAWNGLGWATFNKGDRAAARRAFQEVLKTEPKFSAALNGLGQIALLERKYDEAETYLLRAAPTAPAAWFGLARVYLLQGKYDQATPWAKKIVDSGEADETAKAMLEASQRKSLSDELRQQIEPPELAAAGPAALPADLNVARGWQLMNQGRRDDAQTVFARLIARTPKDADALNGMGWLLFTGGDADEAKQYFERALKSQPNAAGAMNGLARVLKTQGDEAGAIKLWHEMVEKIPGTHAGTAGLAETYFEREDFPNAIPLLEQLAKQDPTDASWQKKLARAKAAVAQ